MGGGGEIVILSTSTSTQIPNHKTSKKNDISKQHSKQAITQSSPTCMYERIVRDFSLIFKEFKVAPL